MVSIRYMLNLSILLLVFVLVSETYGAAAIRTPVPKPAEFADQEGCYEPDINKVLSYEVPFFTQNCGRYICQRNGDIIITSCGLILVPEGEVLLKGNKSLPYPDCCDSIDMSHKPIKS